MKTHIHGHIFAVITVLIWSSTFIVSKILLNTLTPLQILFGRFVMAVIFLCIIYPKFKKPDDKKEELLFFLIGLSLALYFFCENTALLYTYSSNVSLIDSTIPILTGVIAAIVSGSTPFRKHNILGFVFAYSGVAIIIINGNNVQGINPIGDLIALSGAVLFAVYSILIQKLKGVYHSIVLTRKIFFYGAIALGILLIFTKSEFNYEEIDTQIVMGMIFLGIIASSLAFLLWNNAIERIGSVKTNQYIYLVPVFTSIFSAVLLNEGITLIKIAGAALIILGLYISDKLSPDNEINEISSQETIP